MIETSALLAELSNRDVRLWIENGSLKCSAPAGALDAGTRARLAARKDDVIAFLKRAETIERAPANIVPIKPDGSRTPLFVLSGHGGDVYYLLALVRRLDCDRPVLSVQPSGLDGGAPLTSVEALARYEVEQIRLRQPKGPYLLAGHCAGGTIAFEAARQLVAAGEEVALLSLIGSPYPTSFGVMRQRLHRLAGHFEAMRSGTVAERTRYIAGKLRRRLGSCEPQAVPGPVLSAERQRVEAATMAAVRSYKPPTYSGVIDLVITADKWHHADRWASRAGNVRRHVIDDHAINDLLLGPHVDLLVAVLQRQLNELAV